MSLSVDTEGLLCFDWGPDCEVQAELCCPISWRSVVAVGCLLAREATIGEVYQASSSSSSSNSQVCVGMVGMLLMATYVGVLVVNDLTRLLFLH